MMKSMQASFLLAKEEREDMQLEVCTFTYCTGPAQRDTKSLPEEGRFKISF